jgi:hypothetical protein
MGIINSEDIDSPLGDPVKPVEKAIRQVMLGLPDFFDDQASEELLELSLSSTVSASSLMLKSMYEFDLDTEEGVDRLLELLPVLDPDIVKTVMQEIWPGYPVESENFDNNVSRAKIRGYLLDFLDGHGTEAEDIDSTDESEPDGGAEGPEGAEGQE